MKKSILLASLLLLPFQSLLAEQSNVTTSQKDDAVYQDYKWDLGIVGGMVAEGFSGDLRFPTGLGIHGAYHLNDSVTFHGEYIELFTVFGKKDDHKQDKDSDRIIAASVAYDFSADRFYSLYVKGGIGYEALSNEKESVSDFVTLIGIGGRYVFSEHVGGYIEGRWKYGFNQSGNSIIGTLGVDYLFSTGN